MKYLALVVWAFLVYGCFSNTPEPQKRVEIQKICASTQYPITFGKIQASAENMLSKKEFKAILDDALVDCGCFEVVQKPDENTYVLDIKYDFVIDEVKENTSAISSKDSATLKSSIRFTLNNKAKTIQQSATSTLKLSEKKYLGVGDDLQITREQKEELVKRSLNTLFSNLSNMPR
ncbi:hypothetical protein LS71_001185 [Helicobacter jaachi]|uniref:Uncharacterized protein n=1 Tax=Helicobacter jaachi TaxID=1677920 RepID=A0A4U8TCJ9_9HELI|nr:hypothetical protein [Helicobacter jaachi]TLD97394.1 hypothetical protein LS71_001185 [Helicobacter jaachi]